MKCLAISRVHGLREIRFVGSILSSPCPIESEISDGVRVSVNAVASGEEKAEIFFEVVDATCVENLRRAGGGGDERPCGDF